MISVRTDEQAQRAAFVKNCGYFPRKLAITYNNGLRFGGCGYLPLHLNIIRLLIAFISTVSSEHYFAAAKAIRLLH
ncbi:hypothetical protein PANT111_80016 [Pantoea brenneri]|uniref:HAT C-terminal dimerisation domain-containing protein n=1 Tax=Pantoea brenneri TaxID=472694 RepID=A0AAX3JCC6_9GAMM|nr:hypothetical protein PANT111_80016 [Pantoea brenneri]